MPCHSYPKKLKLHQVKITSHINIQPQLQPTTIHTQRTPSPSQPPPPSHAHRLTPPATTTMGNTASKAARTTRKYPTTASPSISSRPSPSSRSTVKASSTRDAGMPSPLPLPLSPYPSPHRSLLPTKPPNFQTLQKHLKRNCTDTPLPRNNPRRPRPRLLLPPHQRLRPASPHPRRRETDANALTQRHDRAAAYQLPHQHQFINFHFQFPLFDHRKYILSRCRSSSQGSTNKPLPPNLPLPHAPRARSRSGV